MEIIPAVDIIEGRCVRLVQGRFEDKTVFSEDPVQTAKRWADEGATMLYVVDLDGARLGQPQNLEVVKRIVQAIDAPVQLGGGIRSIESAKAAIDIGVERVIVGTSAALDSNLAEMMIESLGERLIVGIDALNGYVAVHGWQAHTEEEATAFARRMESLGAKRIIFTDISRDGMLSGVNVEAVERMLESVDVPVIASGGVGSMEDILNLAALGDKGLEGVILGKALYTGAVKLAEALSAVKEVG